MRMGTFVYLSGPITAGYGHTIAQNIDSAVQVYWMLMKDGIPSFCPHLSAAFEEAFEIQYDAWMDYDFRIIDRCTHVLMLPRWETSKGAKMERQYAESIGRPVLLSYGALMHILGEIDHREHKTH